MAKLKVVTMLSLATLFTPVFAQGTNPARPGTINYVEGQAAINGAVISPQSVGVAAVNAGQILATGNGKAEMLLTPGVFLRVGNNSVVKMVSPDLTHTEVSLERGRAEIEVDQLFKQNDLQVDVPNSGGGAQVALIDRGLYEFDAKAGELKVFDGKAAVSESESAKKWIDVKGGHEIALNGSAMKSNGFDKDTSEDDLYHWSALRSQYLGEANASMGAEYAGGGLYPGWAWDAGYGYTWFPYDGLAYSPFGFGFYSPAFFYGGGFGYYGGFRGGFYRGGYGGGFHGGFGGGGGFHGGGGGRR